MAWSVMLLPEMTTTVMPVGMGRLLMSVIWLPGGHNDAVALDIAAAVDFLHFFCLSFLLFLLIGRSIPQ